MAAGAKAALGPVTLLPAVTWMSSQSRTAVLQQVKVGHAVLRGSGTAGRAVPSPGAGEDGAGCFRTDLLSSLKPVIHAAARL